MMARITASLVCFLLINTLCQAQEWEVLTPAALPEKRQESALTAIGNKLYLVGGRMIKPVNVYDPKANTWLAKSPPPLEMHHFQAINYRGEIYVVGAFTGGYPHEKPIPNIYIYNPERDEWRVGPALPADRLRGSGGTVVYNDKFYLVCGIQDGHWDGFVSWFDEYDPRTNTWKRLADAPNSRDHVHGAVVDGKLYVAGGRKSRARTNEVRALTVGAVDVYDFKKATWTTLDSTLNFPTQRAGAAAVVYKNKIVYIGGESDAQVPAHSEVDVYNPARSQWEKLPPLKQGRHSVGAAVLKKDIYITVGAGNRGGSPELNETERFK